MAFEWATHGRSVSSPATRETHLSRPALPLFVGFVSVVEGERIPHFTAFAHQAKAGVALLDVHVLPSAVVISTATSEQGYSRS